MKDETVLPRPCNGPAYDGWKIGEYVELGNVVKRPSLGEMMIHDDLSNE